MRVAKSSAAGVPACLYMVRAIPADGREHWIPPQMQNPWVSPARAARGISQPRNICHDAIEFCNAEM
jgi:hypothetical protein